MVTISRDFEWDMGHRVTNHKSLCKNPHGHRYRLIVQVAGPVIAVHNDAAEGMVLDFGDLKQLISETIVDVYDHSFMYWVKDDVMRKFAESNRELRMLPVSFVPTAECIVGHIADVLRAVLAKDMPTIKLVRLELNETPKCKAIWEA